MGFKCGIVGLPNVGKSTLFNALTATAQAQAENYPFCTVEPNVGRVAVPDTRLESVAGLAGAPRVQPTFLEFVDIAGLVRGASRGEGLGNRFLANIREVDAIAHVLRCFEDGGVMHVEGGIDPARDAGTVETELMLGRPRKPGAALRPGEEARGGGRRGTEGAGAHDGARAGGAGGGQAGAQRRLRPRRRPGGLRGPAAAHRQAGALCVQCRRGGCGSGQ